jgi:hypothetical protein
MGNSTSDQDTHQKENVYNVCNVIPDIPTHNCVIWTNTEEDTMMYSANTGYGDTLPVFLDLRYTADIAPFVRYKDPRLMSMGIISAYLYNLLQTKFNMQWLCNAEHLYYLVITSLYHQTTSQMDGTVVPKEEMTLRDKYPWLQQQVNCKYVYGIDHVFSILREHGIVEDKMEMPSIRLSPLFEFRSYYVAKEEMVMKMALYQNNLILCNLTLFSNVLQLSENRLQLPSKEDQCLGMINVILVGYRDTYWVVRFPFGHRWCENGYCLVSMDYFNRFNRDRWIIVIDSLKQMRVEKEDLSCEFTTMPSLSTLEFVKKNTEENKTKQQAPSRKRMIV